MNRYVSLFVLSMIAGSVFGMGSGTGGGGSGSSGGGTASGGGSNTSQIGEGGRAVRLFDQGVRAMNSKKFAEAQARFAQALTENPRFAEAHNYLGYSLQMEGTQITQTESRPSIRISWCASSEDGSKKRCRERSCDSEKTKSWAGCRAGADNEKRERSERVCGETRRLDPLILRRREKARLSLRGDAPRARTIDTLEKPRRWLSDLLICLA